MHVIYVFAGLIVVGIILFDVFTSVIVPRPVRGSFRLSSHLLRTTWPVWRRASLGSVQPQRQEMLLGIFAPAIMVVLLGVWVVGLIIGYGLIFYGLAAQIQPPPHSLGSATYFAGTSLLTIGFGDFVPTSGLTRFFALAAATTGLATVAIVLTFLFSLFASFQQREVFVVMLDARGSAPPSGLALLETHAQLGLLDDLPRLFVQGQTWAAQVIDTHLAYPVLCFFRSSHVGVSWIAALGAILDAATLIISTVEGIPKGQAALMHDVGSHLTNDVAKYFGLAEPSRNVLVEQHEFRLARSRLSAAGFRLIDEALSWETFQRLRAEYASPLNNMARTWAIAPAQWIGDRSPIGGRHA
jgi:hypothetical protein